MTATLCGGTLTVTRARTTAAEPDLHSHPDSLPPATGRRPEHPFGAAQAGVPAGLADAHSGGSGAA
jgi:hypothetical protein